ncbi:hypothetical protein ILUMI_07908 [Ignelater luminosus]|uniref:Odorant receptor n=1 Tax=Ignelater luminosus TaxID=2038154 RepID=A0A8K0D8I5_IGNLU|nr:hypothetical protein ILUMI_07908 [Ignelater luminosus]
MLEISTELNENNVMLPKTILQDGVVQPTELGKLLTHLAGHFCELLAYCFLGSELIEESTSLSEAIFACDWHLLQDDINFKKTLLMMIIRSQKEVHLTAAGFSVLHLPAFLKILRTNGKDVSSFVQREEEILSTLMNHQKRYEYLLRMLCEDDLSRTDFEQHQNPLPYTSLSDAIFACGWHLLQDNIEFKKTLLMVISRLIPCKGMFEEPTRIRINRKLIASPKKKTLPKSVFRDGVKWALVPAKIILDSLGLWPEELSKLYIIFISIANVIILIGNVQHVQDNDNTLTEIVSVITVTMIVIESDKKGERGERDKRGKRDKRDTRDKRNKRDNKDKRDKTDKRDKRNKSAKSHRNFLPTAVFRDDVKWMLIPSKIILDGLGLWPENLNKYSIIFISLSTAIIVVGQGYYLTENSHNFAKIISACIVVMVVIESTALSDAIFECGWHLLQDNIEFKKSLLMMMIRSQKEVHLTAAGFSVLRLPTFLKVSKLN